MNSRQDRHRGWHHGPPHFGPPEPPEPPEPPMPPGPPHFGRGRGRRPGRPGRGFPFGGFGGPGFGGPGFGGPGFGWGGPGSKGWPGWEGRGQRARRGDVRAAALALLAERPMNGYQIIQEIKQRSGGMWTASSGSVYPALQQLEDEGLIQAGEHEGRRAFSLTDAGRRYAEENQEELAAPWDAATEGADDVMDLREAIGRTMGAVHQVFSAGTDEQRARAVEVLNETRKALYRILAEEEDPEA